MQSFIFFKDFLIWKHQVEFNFRIKVITSPEKHEKRCQPGKGPLRGRGGALGVLPVPHYPPTPPGDTPKLTRGQGQVWQVGGAPLPTLCPIAVHNFLQSRMGRAVVEFAVCGRALRGGRGEVGRGWGQQLAPVLLDGLDPPIELKQKWKL